MCDVQKTMPPSHEGTKAEGSVTSDGVQGEKVDMVPVSSVKCQGSKPVKRRMSHVTYVFAVLAACAAARAATLPPPPWQAQSRGPTSSFEITSYIAAVAPLLDASTRRAIETLLASNQPPVHALPLIQSARWRSAVSAATAPWHLAPDDAAGASTHLAYNLDALGDHLDLTTTATNTPLSLAETLAAMRLLDDLKQRAANPADPLADLSRYTLLYRLRGAPLTISWWAQTCYRRQQFDRAEHLLRFLIADANPDGFSKGNAHHFLGHLLFYGRERLDDAFVHFLSVQKYPACLVFSAYAYVHAAAILGKMNMPIHALALLAVDVPCLEFADVAFARHWRSAVLRMQCRDFTNALRHLQAALVLQESRSNDVRDLYRAIPDASAIWEAVATQRWSAADADAAIEHALTNRWDTPDDRLFLDALLHDWPAQEDIPLHIATNRVLNNNIFPRRVRRVRAYNRPTQGE